MRAEGAQRAHADRARRGAVRVVVRDDEDALAGGDRLGEDARRVVHVGEAFRGGERLQRRRELVVGDDPARGEDAGEPRIASAREEAREGGFFDGPRDDLRHGRRGASRGAATAGARRGRGSRRGNLPRGEG